MHACGQIVWPYSYNKQPISVLSDAEAASLKSMESKALADDTAGAEADVKALRTSLNTRLASATDAYEKLAITNYLTCTDDTKDSTGLAWRNVQLCQNYDVKALARCEALGRVRAALRCMTLPCITSKEDGRLQRVYKSSTGSEEPFDPWPE
jgi:hypothetical protein